MKKLFCLVCTGLMVWGCNSVPEFNKDEKPSDYISARHLQEKLNSTLIYSSEEQWDSINQISHEQTKSGKGTISSDYKVFGWHPYTNGSSYKSYNFSMLWGISYVGYIMQAQTGSYKSIHEWKTTALIDSAKAHGCKTFLSVVNFGGKNNATFLNSPKAQTTLIDSIASLLKFRDADGINIDFEGVPKESKQDFIDFIGLVSGKLKAINPDYLISLCLYAIDWNDIFDLSALDLHIDFYTLMAYDYNGSFSKIAAPVTPFKTSKVFGHSLQGTIKSYQDKGIVNSKLIVGLPYYGAEYYTDSDKVGAKVLKFKTHPSYKTTKSLYIDSLKIPILYDSLSGSSYLLIKDSINAYRQIWFESENSLSEKYQWLKTQNVGGIGIWALGFDHGYSNLWDLLEKEFSE